MTRDERDALVEAAVTAFREIAPGGRLLPSPAWMDLPPADRVELFERQIEARRLESALDPDGLSSTGRAVLARVRRLAQLPPRE